VDDLAAAYSRRHRLDHFVHPVGAVARQDALDRGAPEWLERSSWQLASPDAEKNDLGETTKRRIELSVPNNGKR
jgi:hypothetical protein